MFSLYTTYQLWFFGSNLLGSLNGVIATYNMLSLASKDSLSNTFAYSYVGKDIIGQLVVILYMKFFGSHYDLSPLWYARIALISQILSCGLEAATPLLSPSLFFPTIVLSNVLINLAWIGIGAINTKNIITLNGTTEIAHKLSNFGAWDSFWSALGMGLGTLVVYLVSSYQTRLFLMIPTSILQYLLFNQAFSKVVHSTPEDPDLEAGSITYHNLDSDLNS